MLVLQKYVSESDLNQHDRNGVAMVASIKERVGLIGQQVFENGVSLVGRFIKDVVDGSFWIPSLELTPIKAVLLGDYGF